MEQNVKTVLKLPRRLNLRKICRCCLSESPLMSIFRLKYDGILLSDIFSKLFCTEVNSNDKLPKKVCEPCIGQIIRFYEFKKTIDVAEEILSTAVANSTKPAHHLKLLKIENLADDLLQSNVKFVEDPGEYKIFQIVDDKDDNSQNEANDEIVDNLEESSSNEKHKAENLNNSHVNKTDNNNKEAKEQPSVVGADAANAAPPSIYIKLSEPVKSSSANVAQGNKERKPASFSKIVPCPYCPQKFATQSEYYTHRKKYRYQACHRRKHPCEICGKLFTSSYLIEHVRTHTKEKPIECGICSMKFGSATNLARHRKIHTGEKPHVCEFCGKGFIQSATLEDHRRLHTGEKPYLCSYCGQSFSNRPSHAQHMKKHVGGQARKIKAPRKPAKKEMDMECLRCNICVKVFKSKTILKGHMKIHGEKTVLCNICGKGFFTKMALSSHTKRNHRGEKPIFHCTHCTRKFMNRFHYKTHMENEHGDDKVSAEDEAQGRRHPCPVCQKVYSTKQILNNHMIVHGDKKFLCSECGKDFYTNYALQQHIAVHTGEKRYSCKYCDKKFTQPGALRTHTYIHTGEKPYVCMICSKSFTQGPHLKIHLRTHSGEKPYTCSYCGKSFSHRATLTVHVRSHTGETPYVCNVCSKGFYHLTSLKKHKKCHLKEPKVELNIDEKEEP